MTSFLTRRGFTIGYFWAVLGALLLIAGVIVDLARHASGGAHPDERIFTTSNPGHVIAIAGMYNLAAGLLLAGLSRWVLGRFPRSMTLAAVVLPLIAAAAFSAGLVRLDSEIGHSNEAAHGASNEAGAHGHTRFTVIRPENNPITRLDLLTLHEPAVTTPVTLENLRYTEDFLDRARAATEKYKDVEVAVGDGYIQFTPYAPLVGAHFGNAAYASKLDPATPPILLYRPVKGGGLELVGVSYVMLREGDKPPVTPFGGVVQWHYHTDLCIDVEELTVVAAPDASACDGVFVEETPWLLHAWLWLDSPEGIFDHANSLLQ